MTQIVFLNPYQNIIFTSVERREVKGLSKLLLCFLLFFFTMQFFMEISDMNLEKHTIKYYTNRYIPEGGIKELFSSSSKIECASQCAMEPLCRAGAGYDKASSTCSLYYDGIYVQDNSVAVRAVLTIPERKGQILIQRSDLLRST